MPTIRPTASPPRIARNSEIDARTVRVEYVFADGRRAVVSVPRERWIDGGHTPVGPRLAKMLEELDLQRERRASRLHE